MLPARPRLLATAALVAALVLPACSGTSDSSSEPAVVGSDAVTLDATSSTTTTAAPATTTTVAPVGLATPLEAAQGLYDSWKADDKARAATLAEPAAVEGQWATAPGDYALYNNCDSAEFDTSGCLFRGAGGTIQYTMEKSAGNMWVVVTAFFSAP